MEPKVRMYRKHGKGHVVDVDNVWPIVPVTDGAYLEWLAEGNSPIEQDETEGETSDNT